MAYINRRHFLKRSTALGFAAGSGLLATLGTQQALAANVSGYKALVCVFLKGGIDAADVILPYDQGSHDALGAIRPGLFGQYGVGSGTSSRDIANLLKLNPTNASEFGGREFALSPEMSEIHALFEAGNAAIIGNVGPLIEPTTRDTMEAGSVELPRRLFSHNDQQSTWMSSGIEGSLAGRVGWGGRFADAIRLADPASNHVFTGISIAGNDVYLSGESVRPFITSTGTPKGARILSNRGTLGKSSEGDAARQLMRDHLLQSGLTSSNLFEKDVMDVSERAITNIETYKNAIDGGSGLAQAFPDTSLGRQLQKIAETMSVRGTLNVSRQIFYAAIGGFDSHDNQANNIPGRLSEISQAVSAFNSAMTELGLSQDVTLFTASDFGRTLTDNDDGTDHGWGGHHFAVGGAVQGQKIFGSIPSYDLSDQSYTVSRGRLIPSVSVDQYAASLGGWFGLNTDELNAALPNLSNFGTSLDLFGV